VPICNHILKLGHVILTDEDYRKIGKSIAIALIKETCEKAPD